MLSVRGRKPVSVVVEPLARLLVRFNITPNMMTVGGAVVSIALAVTLIPTGHLFAAAVLTGVFTLADLVDGTMARLTGGGTRFGATLDASCDRITDGALFGAITWWLVYSYDASRMLVAASLVVLVFSQVISYVKARGEASGLRVVGGLIERPERLIIGLVGVGLTGLGVPYAIDVAVWILAITSIFTVVQRLIMSARAVGAQGAIAAPAGADPSPRAR